MSFSLSPFDPTEDFSLFDGAETVSYQSYDPASNSYGSAFDIVCLFRQRDDVVSPINQGENAPSSVPVHFPSCQFFRSYPPKRLDKFRRFADTLNEDDETEWIIQNVVQTQTLGTRYRVLAVKVHKVNT